MIELAALGRAPRNAAVLLSLAGAGALPAVTASAQTTEGSGFDEGRAFISETTIFEPFLVTDEDVSSLRDAVAAGVVQTDTWLVVMEHDRGRLAMVMDQMAYHHVAQGDLMGEPWMVSF